MAKGSQAKINVTNKIANAFGEDWIGEVNKKLYVWADDGGERVQISIALTCPKVMVDAPDKNFVPDNDWSDEGTSAPVAKAKITEEEKKNIADLMERLGL
jgi:hypothetical protein